MLKSEGRDAYTVLKFNDVGDFEGTYRVDNRAPLGGRLVRNKRTGSVVGYDKPRGVLFVSLVETLSARIGALGRPAFVARMARVDGAADQPCGQELPVTARIASISRLVAVPTRREMIPRSTPS